MCGGYAGGLWSQPAWIQRLVLPFFSSMTWASYLTTSCMFPLLEIKILIIYFYGIVIQTKLRCIGRTLRTVSSTAVGKFFL